MESHVESIVDSIVEQELTIRKGKANRNFAKVLNLNIYVLYIVLLTLFTQTSCYVNYIINNISLHI